MARHLLVTNDFPPKTGGIQVYLWELWRRLDSGEATVLTASSHPDASHFDAASDLVVERVRATTLYLPTPGALRAVRAAIARHDPDLVLFDPAWPLGLLGPHLDRPYGVILHGAEVRIPASIPVVASSLRRVVRHASVCVAAGAYPEAEARRNVGDGLPPVIQVPPGVDVDRFVPLSDGERAAARAHFGWAPDEFVVTAYSRLVPRKGFDTLIDAAATLAPVYPSLRVVIGGTGRDERRLRRLAARAKAPVTFVGRVDDDDLPRWLGASDLMVMDCRTRWLGLEAEGFGIVFLEAAAAGVPVVAGRSGGSHEAVRDGETGVVVRWPRDVHALAQAIAGFVDDPDRRTAMGQRAWEVAVEQYSWDALARRLQSELDRRRQSGVPSTLA